MVRQLFGEIGEQLMEQGKQTGQAMQQTPKTVFQRIVGEKLDEEKKQEKEQEEIAKEQGYTSVKSMQQHQAKQGPLSQTDLRRQQLQAEEAAKTKRLRKLLHQNIFKDAERIKRLKEEKERLKAMQEQEEQKKKQQKQVDFIEQQKKDEALDVKRAQQAKGAGEHGPKAPK